MILELTYDVLISIFDSLYQFFYIFAAYVNIPIKDIFNFTLNIVSPYSDPYKLTLNFTEIPVIGDILDSSWGFVMSFFGGGNMPIWQFFFTYVSVILLVYALINMCKNIFK